MPRRSDGLDMWCLAKNLGRQTSIRWLVISAFASVPSVSIAEEFCQTVQSALEMKDNGGFPQTVALAGKSFDCRAISEGAWSCNIAAENQCSPKQDKSLVANAGGAKVPPSADEIKVAYERVGSAIAGCFPDKAAQPLEYRSLAPLALTLGRATTPQEGGKSVYALARIVQKTTDDQLCRSAKVALEVEDEKSFKPFEE